jgi:hypothetical protein
MCLLRNVMIYLSRLNNYKPVLKYIILSLIGYISPILFIFLVGAVFSGHSVIFSHFSCANVSLTESFCILQYIYIIFIVSVPALISGPILYLIDQKFLLIKIKKKSYRWVALFITAYLITNFILLVIAMLVGPILEQMFGIRLPNW